MTLERRRLGRRGLAASRIGIGLAALGRPAYITLGRDRDLPGDRDPEAMYARTAAVLDAARAAGIRYVDVARSYGRAEEFLARWLRERAVPPTALIIGSKWGYAYTAGWRLDAAVHEEKALTRDRFRAQLAESRALLGDRLALYQIHSATVESGCLDDTTLLRALVDARRDGTVRAIGLTLSGPRSAETLRAALDARVEGEPVFDVVQATFNLLEPSLAPVLAQAGARGLGVIAKEVHANGRLTPANTRPADAPLHDRLRRIAEAAGMTVDQLAMAFVLSHDAVDVALSGAALPAHLRSHVASATRAPLPRDVLERLASETEPPEQYWATRAAFPWT